MDSVFDNEVIYRQWYLSVEAVERRGEADDDKM